ncbi:MAG: BREX system P-loop protein BrxC [Desulfobacteraceae bacterium]|nr:MAG: BREX system P-loop protein BrxC [Desulfobacteraceae bacterium]
MLIKDIFSADVTRDIAPVVYFHEKAPEKVAEEVSEYIITGGYPESDPRHKRIESGIHEQFVSLLKALSAELRKENGVELPASWVSGFYGSGKSSFAKLLGLALDGLVLPDSRPLAEALLSRDDSPKAQDFKKVWEDVRSQIDPIAVVFDIGSVARDNEHIHSAVKREIQHRLGYCTISNHVAEHELKLEIDGLWQDFLVQAEKTLGKTWDEAKTHQLAEEDFSEVLHAMHPERYTDPMSWIDSRAGSQSTIGSSVSETTKAITEMLNIRAPGKTLFIIVDEVYQYIHQNDNRVLKLQSFVSDLGQKLKGLVWLIATGQQKLEDADDEDNIGKLKDRFPNKLRVHLSVTNIRDVVHKRLLKKDPSKESLLRDLFHTNRSDLKLYGYSCGAITEEDFLEVYPMLPGHVDLLMQITSSLRTRSSRIKGDDHAIRGLLQLLGELFRDQALGEKELGALVTLDNIYEVQQTALDADIQNTMMRILIHEDITNDELAVRVAKVVSLLELIQEQEPTTIQLISQCLYARIGMGNIESEVQKALEKLTRLGLLSYSEKLGYKLQSSAGQEWQKERDSFGITADEISSIVGEKLKDLMGTLDRPRLKRKAFPWTAYFSDGKQKKDELIQNPNDQASVYVDFRYFTNNDDRSSSIWITESDSQHLKNRMIWVAGSVGTLPSLIRDLARSRHTVNRYAPRVQSLSKNKQRLYYEEQSRCEELEKQTQSATAQIFMDGEIYYKGRIIDKQAQGSTFATVIHGAAESILPELYNMFVDMAVTPGELNQLLEPTLSGPSNKFMNGELGILELDAGRYIPTCSGEVPSRILRYIEDEGGSAGNVLLNKFGGPPCGYPADVIKACLVGLLRATKIRIRPDAGPEITSVRDPGVKDMFQKDRDLKRADVLPPSGTGIGPRDRNAICNFFKDSLDIDLDRENDAIADAVFQQFPGQVKRLQELEAKFNRLPGRPELPESLSKLRQALEDCKRSRHIEPTVLEMKKNLDVLRDGMQQLGILLTELTDQNLEAVRRAQDIQNFRVSQLQAIDGLGEAEEAARILDKQLLQERPWRDISSIDPHLTVIQDRYREVRLELIERQEQMAQKIRERIKQRTGFEKLSNDQVYNVLRPITLKLYDTTPDAINPTLELLKDSVVSRLREAEEEANDRLDDFLSELTEKQVVRFQINLKGREVSTSEEVEMMINELRERLLAQLKDNMRIRLI